MKTSQGKKHKFLERVNQMSSDREKQGLRQYVLIRWNFTYIMLDCVLYYESIFSHLALSDLNYKYCPSEDEWNKLKRISNYLGLFLMKLLAHFLGQSIHFKCVLSKSICCLCNVEGVFKKWGWVYERHRQEDS